MNQSVRRVALHGYLGSGNIGNDASLETFLASQYPDVEVRCITIAAREKAARYGFPSVPWSWHSSAQGRSRWIHEEMDTCHGT